MTLNGILEDRVLFQLIGSHMLLQTKSNQEVSHVSFIVSATAE